MTSFLKKTLLCASLIVLLSLGGTVSVHAADPAPTSTTSPSDTTQSGTPSFQALTQLPQIESAASSDTLPIFLNQLYKILIGVGAVLAVFMIMWAGVQIMTSQGSVSSNEAAKSRLQNAILGLILLLSPVVVFSVINPDILNLSLNFSSLTPDANPFPDGYKDYADKSATTNTCASYKNITALPKGFVCKASNGYVSIDTQCCSVQTEAGCCGIPLNQETTYLLAYTMKATPKPGEKVQTCTVQAAQYFSTKAECDKFISQDDYGLKLLYKLGSADRTYSDLNILKSCELVADKSYTLPQSTNVCGT